MTNLPATVQLSTLSREIGELTERLAPAEPDAISKHLLSLRKAGMSIPSGMKPEDLEAVYTYALSEVPAYGLRKAVEKIIKGEYAIKYGFIPLPPELAAMARSEARVIREDLVRLREKQETLATIANGPAPEPDKDAIARVAKMRREFLQWHNDEKIANGKMMASQPMSEERIAMLEKISSLPDAKTISAEQQAYRRRVSAEIEKAKGE